MKNKHLVLLFVGILVLGWIGRNIQFGQESEIKARIFKQDTGVLHKIQLVDKDTVTFLKTDLGWMISTQHDIFPAPDSLSDRLLRALSEMETVRLLHTKQADTVWLNVRKRLHLISYAAASPQVQHFYIGKEDSKGQSTWVGLPNHDQYYLVKGQLRSFFQTKWDNLRPQPRQYAADTAGVVNIRLLRSGDTLMTLPALPLSDWLRGWQSCTHKAAEFDLFDLRAGGGTFFARVCFYYQNQPETPVCCKLIYLDHPDLPDDPAKRRYFRHFKPRYLIETENQPGIYYTVTDTQAIRRLFQLQHEKSKKK